MTDRHFQLITHLSRLVAPFAAVTPDDAGKRRFAALLVSAFRTLEQLARAGFQNQGQHNELENALKGALLSAYGDYYQQPTNYDTTAATAGLCRLLRDNERISVMEMLKRVANDAVPLNEALDQIQKYSDSLGLIWDRATDTFSVNMWGAEPLSAAAPVAASAAPTGGPPADGRSLSELMTLVRASAGSLDVQRTHDGGNGMPFVVIYGNSPTDVNVWRAIASSQQQLVLQAGLRLVMCDGATSVIDTSPAWAWGESEIQGMFEQRKISCAEYCHIRLRGAFTCLGVDDSELYSQSAERFKRGDHFGVNQLETPRAAKIVARALTSMSDLGVGFAALQLTGHLPDLVADGLEQRRASFVVLTLQKTGLWNRIFQKGSSG